jgi:YD repeat-containing protein
LDVSVVSSRLTQIVDPDTTAYHTDFAYDGSGRMTSRTNRRTFANSYVYVKGLRVDTVRVRLDTVSPTYAVTAFRPWDEQGLATGPTGQTAIDTGLAYTRIDGARRNVVDTAEFWVDRWGAPTQVRDPLGNVTKLTRGDATNPALVTRVQDPLGAVAKATYNSRADLPPNTGAGIIRLPRG